MTIIAFAQMAINPFNPVCGIVFGEMTNNYALYANMEKKFPLFFVTLDTPRQGGSALLF